MDARIKNIVTGDDFDMGSVRPEVRAAVEESAASGKVKGKAVCDGQEYRWVLDAASVVQVLGLTPEEIERAGGSIWGAEYTRRFAGMTPEEIDRYHGIDRDAVLED